MELTVTSHQKLLIQSWVPSFICILYLKRNRIEGGTGRNMVYFNTVNVKCYINYHFKI